MRVSAAVPVLAAVGLASAQSCPAVGEKNAEGLVSCDPKVELPSGQLCVLEGECYFIEGTGLIIPSSTASAAPTSTSCPAAGETNAEGDYSCNPAHQYPNGQLCVLKAGCYYLEGTGLLVSTTTTGSAAPTGTPCPAPGTTNAAGDYSCNPAHQYPDGQLCVLKGGCYYLEGTGLKTPTHGPTHGKVKPQPTHVVVAGAPQQTALGGLAAAIGLVAAML